MKTSVQRFVGKVQNGNVGLNEFLEKAAHRAMDQYVAFVEAGMHPLEAESEAKRNSAYPIDSTSPKGWGRARCARSIFDHCTSLESSSVTRPPIGAHNDRLIKNVAPPRRTAMAASRYFSDWVASSNPQPTSNCT